MHPIPILLVLLLLAAAVVGVAAALRTRQKQRGRVRAWTAAGGTFLAAGIVGFLGTALAGAGGLGWLPSSCEWPVGLATGVVATGDHFLVPHQPAGRLQVYDADWGFVRGWWVDAAGGGYKITAVDDGEIEVVTARGNRRYRFDLEGRLRWTEVYVPGGAYDAFPELGELRLVPTAPWLWAFSHPFLSLATAALGMVMLFHRDRLLERPRRPPAASGPEPPSCQLT